MNSSWDCYLQPLKSSNSLTSDILNLVREPLEHVVVDLLEEVVVDGCLLAHEFEQSVEHEADPKPGLGTLDAVVVQQPVDQSPEERRKFHVVVLLRGLKKPRWRSR